MTYPCPSRGDEAVKEITPRVQNDEAETFISLVSGGRGLVRHPRRAVKGSPRQKRDCLNIPSSRLELYTSQHTTPTTFDSSKRIEPPGWDIALPF